MEKIPLLLIDIENWRFCLYKAPNDDLYCDFPYSPVSYADFSMLLKLNPLEVDKIKADRNYLFEMSDHVRDNYKIFLQRALNEKDFLLLDKNDLLEVYSNSMSNNKNKFIEFCVQNKVKGCENYIQEFDKIQDDIYTKIDKITPNGMQLTSNEIENFCSEYSKEKYLWIRDKGIQALNRWLIWMCWHEGILKS